MLDLDVQHFRAPPSTLAKLREMQDRREAAFALAQVALAKLREATAEYRHAEDQLAEMDRSQPGVAYPRAVREKELASAQAAKQRAGEEVVLRRARYDAATQAANEAGACLQELEGWLRKLDGLVEFRPFARPVPSPVRKGEPVHAALDRVRSDIANLKADLHRIASAPITSTEAKAQVRREVEALAEQGEPDLGRVFAGQPIRWPTYTPRTPSGQIITTDLFDARATLVWLMRAPLLARLDAEIDALSDDAAALSAEQRRTEDARVRAEILALERAEESIIESAPAGVVIHRRQKADPRAVLNLADDLPGYEYD